MGDHLGHAVLAVLATGAYYVSFVLFRASALGMPPLRGSRPIVVTRLMLTSPTWFIGGLILFVGLAYQVIAFATLPPALVQPTFAVSLVLLLAYSVWIIGERLTGREWTSVGLFVTATVLMGASARAESAATVEQNLIDAFQRPWPMLVAAAPALLAAGVVWLVGDRRAGGRHAKPLAGVAYGIGAGACAGLAEVGIRGMAILYDDTGSALAVLHSPYPLLTLGMAGLALIQLQVALQRCRLAVIATVITVIGRTYLLLAGMLLFDEGWPDEVGASALRAAGLTLALTAVLVFPRHEHPPQQATPRGTVAG